MTICKTLTAPGREAFPLRHSNTKVYLIPRNGSKSVSLSPPHGMEYTAKEEDEYMDMDPSDV